MVLFSRASWLTIAFTLLAICYHGISAATRRFELNITMQMLNPDCFNQSYATPVVNGQFPGPTIRVVQGDYVEVLVRNQMTDRPTTVHFHGIRQYGSVNADGVPYVTQAPIPPGESYLHRFRVINQSGTYFYHAHVGMQADTLHGAFIVHEDEDSIPLDDGSLQQRHGYPHKHHHHHHHLLHYHYPFDHLRKLRDGPYIYDEERTIQLTEWWHYSLDQREELLLGPQSASILFNGHTVFNANSSNQNDLTCPGFTTFQVEEDKTYRFRIIGGNTFLILGLSFMDHPMTIIEVDGELVEPYQVDTLEVAPAQRFSVLIHTKKRLRQSSENPRFVIATTYRWRTVGEGYTDNGYGYLEYVDKSERRQRTSDAEYFTRAPIAKNQLAPLPANTDVVDWIWPELAPVRPHEYHHVLHRQADRTIKIRPLEVVGQNGTTGDVYYINGRPPLDIAPSVLLHEYEQSPVDFVADTRQMEPDGFNPVHQTFPIQYGDIVDIVLQNTMVAAANNCFPHPWHTHGHSHYMIATGSGEYNHQVHQDIRNIPRPVYKDVSTVYPSTPEDPALRGADGMGCGWIKIRLVAVSYLRMQSSFRTAVANLFT